MAGYFLYTIDSGIFRQLTTTPTRDQGDVLADWVLEDIEGFLDDCEADASKWPEDKNALSNVIVGRLARADWYADLPREDAEMWDNIIFGLNEDPGETLGVDFRCSDYESVYWDCVGLAAKKGCKLMETFGGIGFRYSGTPAGYDPMYAFYTPEQCVEMLSQLNGMRNEFEVMPGGEGSDREQFFDGLLPPITYAAENQRVLWVQTDT